MALSLCFPSPEKKDLSDSTPTRCLEAYPELIGSPSVQCTKSQVFLQNLRLRAETTSAACYLKVACRNYLMLRATDKEMGRAEGVTSAGITILIVWLFYCQQEPLQAGAACSGNLLCISGELSRKKPGTATLRSSEEVAMYPSRVCGSMSKDHGEELFQASGLVVKGLGANILGRRASGFSTTVQGF